MSTIPKLLTTKYLFHADLAKAALEAMNNAGRLVQAGFIQEAHRVLLALVEPGTWQTPFKFTQRYELWQQLVFLRQYLGLTPLLPKADDRSGQSAVSDLNLAANRIFGGAQREALAAREVDLQQVRVILATVVEGRYGDAFNRFQSTADETMEARVSLRAAFERANLNFTQSFPDDHGLLADAIEQGGMKAFPRETLRTCSSIELKAALLDVFAGNKQAAINRLGRILPREAVPKDYWYWQFPTYLAFLSQGYLAESFKLDAAGVSAYLAAFASRSPMTIQIDKPLPWAKRLKQFVSEQTEAGIDSAALLADLDAAAPLSRTLRQRASKSMLLNKPVAIADIEQAEQRLGMALPPSYREFLSAANGLIVPDFVSLLPVAEIDWLRNLDAETLNGWQSGKGPDDQASDAEYATYGLDQDCTAMRVQHLRHCLQISTNLDGDVLLLNPEVRFGDEWEAWFLGAKNPGAYRAKSFRDLLEHYVLVST